MSLLTKYRILQEVVRLLGLGEYIAFGSGLFFLGAKEMDITWLFLGLMVTLYYIRDRLEYKVMELMLKLNREGIL